MKLEFRRHRGYLDLGESGNCMGELLYETNLERFEILYMVVCDRMLTKVSTSRNSEMEHVS